MVMVNKKNLKVQLMSPIVAALKLATLSRNRKSSRFRVTRLPSDPPSRFQAEFPDSQRDQTLRSIMIIGTNIMARPFH